MCDEVMIGLFTYITFKGGVIFVNGYIRIHFVIIIEYECKHTNGYTNVTVYITIINQ